MRNAEKGGTHEVSTGEYWHSHTHGYTAALPVACAPCGLCTAPPCGMCCLWPGRKAAARHVVCALLVVEAAVLPRLGAPAAPARCLCGLGI